MVSKVDTRPIFERALSSPLPARKGAGPDFHLFLREKLDKEAPLHWITLDYLKRALETALKETNPNEAEFFPPLRLSLPLKSPVPPEPSSPPEPVEIELDSPMSNNLRGEQEIEPIIREAGQRHGVNPSLIKAVIQAESGGNPLAVSRAGARGLMQLMPATAAELGVTNSFDPAENIMAGTRYLRKLMDRYGGDVKLALAAYNWGMGNLETRPEAMPRETKNYISQVENLYRNYSKA